MVDEKGIMKALETTAAKLKKTVNELLSQTELFVQGTTIATNVLMKKIYRMIVQ